MNRKTMLLIAALFVTVGVGIVVQLLMPAWRWIHYPTHAAVEALGGFTAVLMAVLIETLRRFRKLGARYAWVSAALAAMGILDSAHALTHAGALFVWLHSIATFIGGVLFAGIWLRKPGAWIERLPLVALLGAVATVAGSVLLGPMLPAMATPAGFTVTARALNIVGAVGFFAAAFFFVLSRRPLVAAERIVFGSHCSLFGFAGVLFELSMVWDAAWWIWHGVRLAAYLVGASYFLRIFYAAQTALQRAHDDLERQVVDRTATLQTEIVQRERAERALRQHAADLARSNEDLAQFAYVASHDLRAPLRAIDNLAAWIDEDCRDALSDECRGHLDLLRGRAQRLDKLLSDLLTYSRAGRSKEKTRIDIAELATEIAGSLPRAGFSVKNAPDLPVLSAPRAAMVQVLSNLLGNAVKHHDRESGTISISARDLGDRFEFTVSDDGPGIPTEHHGRVFKMFQTLKRRDECDGSGMGLALVRKVVEQQGGKLILESGEDRGSTFRFTWPKQGPNSKERTCDDAGTEHGSTALG